MQVITFDAPGGGEIDLTPAQRDKLLAADAWPRNHRGEYISNVLHGLHEGTPTYTDAEIARLCTEARA